METTANALHFDSSSVPMSTTFDELQSGPFITVVSVDGGSFCGNKLTVITPPENLEGKQFNGENDNGGFENGHNNAWLHANGKDYNKNPNESNNENLNLASSEGESGPTAKRDDAEDDFNCGGAAYVTVLALGKNQRDNESSQSPSSNLTHGNGSLEKKSIVNIFNTDDEATLFPGYNGPQAQAHIAYPEVESSGIGIAPECTDNGRENGCGKEMDDEEQAPSRPPPPLPQSPSPFPFRRRQKSIVSIEESPEIVENVTVYRLPGERLGFGLRFEGIGVSNPLEKVEHVFIQSCADASPAQRTLTSWGHLVEGDEILEIEHTPVTEMTRLDCVSALKDASVAVHLLIRHLSNTNEVKLHTTAKVVISNELTPVSHFDINTSTTPLYNDNEQQMLDDRGFRCSDSMFGDDDIGGGPHQDADLYEPDEYGRGCVDMENRVLYGEDGRMNRSIDTPSRLSPRKLNIRSRSGTPPLLLPQRPRSRSSNSRKSHAHHQRLVRSKSVGYNNYTAMGYEHGTKPEVWTGFGRDQQRHTHRAKSSSSFYSSKSTPSSPAPFYPPTTFQCHYNANGLVELVPQTMNHLNDRERFAVNESLSACEYRPSSMDHYYNGYNNVNINNDGLGSDYYDDYGTASSTRSTVVSRLSLASTATVFSEFQQQIHATITDHAPNVDNKPQQCNGHHTNAALNQMELEGTEFCSSINNSNNKRQVTLNHADADGTSAKEPACAESCSANEVPLTPPLYFQDNVTQSNHLQHAETRKQIEEGGPREGAAISHSYNKGHCQSHSDNNELNPMVFNRIKSMNMVQVLEDMNKFNVFTNANNNRLCDENGHSSRPHSARSNQSQHQYQHQHAPLPRDSDAVLEQFFPGDDEEEDELSMFTEELGGYGPDGEPRQWVDNREEFEKILSRNETIPKDGPEVTIRIEWLHDIEEVQNSDSEELTTNDEKTDAEDTGQAVDETSAESTQPDFQAIEPVTAGDEIVPEGDVAIADAVACPDDSEIKPMEEHEKPDTSVPGETGPSIPTPKRRKRNKENSAQQPQHQLNHTGLPEDLNLADEIVIAEKEEATNGTDCDRKPSSGTEFLYDDLIVSSPSLTPTIPHKHKSHSEEEKTRGGELSRCIQYVNPTAIGLNSVPLFLLTHENVIEEQNEEDDADAAAVESGKLIYSSTKEIIINRIPDYESVESTNVFETMTVTSKKRELIPEEVVPLDCSYEHVEYASNDLHDQQIYEFKTFGKSNSNTDASLNQIGVNQKREKAEWSQTDDNSNNHKAIKESLNDNAEIDSICASESVKPPIIVERKNKPKHQESGSKSTELNEAVKEQIPRHSGPEFQDKSDLIQGETQSAKDHLVQQEPDKNVTRDNKDEIKMTNQILVVRPRPVATIHMSKIPRPAFSNAVQPPLVSKMTPSMTLIPRMVTSLAMTSDSKGEWNTKPKASGLPGLLSRISKPGIKLVKEGKNVLAKKPQSPSPAPAPTPSPTPTASPAAPPTQPVSVQKDEPPPPPPRSPLKSILKQPSAKASAVEEKENVPAEVPDPVLKGDSKVNNTDANSETIDMENSVLNSFDHHTQVRFEQPSLAPRLPPDGHEFPNTWLDEGAGDASESLKPYRSSDFSVSKANGSDLNWARPDSPPPPPPRTEPPLLDADSSVSAYPQIPSQPPPVTSRVRKNSVEERKRQFELSSVAQANDIMEAPVVPPKTVEPSRRSVKDKIAMFSSAAGEGAPVPTSNSSMSSSLSFPSANTNGYSKMSKSTDHLPGISSGNLQLHCEINDANQNQNKAEARQVSFHDQHESLRSVKPMGERSQSLLNIGNSQTPTPAVIEERRRGTMSKLRGLVIPDKPGIAQNSVSVMDLPTIYSKDVSPVKSMSNPSPPIAKLQPAVPPVPALRKHNLSRTESLDGVSSSSDGYNRSHKLVSKPSVPPPGPPSTGLTDWKMGTALPKYSPAFKRRSLTAYQTAITSPTMKPQLSSNFKATTLTPEPKSLESCTSPRSDSSFEYASPISDKPKIVGITTLTSLQRNHATADVAANNATIKQEQKVTFDPNQKSGTKDSPKRTRSGKIVEDSDTDSAVSSSRSSISHELSPPNSPLPSKENQATQRTENSTSGQQRYPGQEVVDGTSTTEDSANNSDEGWRILKPQSVEAINRKNVLTSAKFSNGTFADSLPKSGEEQNGRTIYNNHDHHIRRSDDEEAGYADGETEDTESSCSELDTGKSRRHSGQMAHHHTQHMSLAKRPITDTEDDDDDYEENLQTSNLTPNSASEEKQQTYPEKQIITAVKAPNEDPLQAIYDMEVKMAYVNEICDSLPCTRVQQPDHRFFSRRESEATVIEYPIERKSSTSSSTVTVTSEQDLRTKGKSISSTSSIDEVDSNTNDQLNSLSIARKHSLPTTGPITSTPVQAASSSRRNSVDDTSTTPLTATKSPSLDKKYSTSMTSVNLLSSLKKQESSIDTPRPTLAAAVSTSSLVEKKIEKFIEATGAASPNKPSPVTGKSKFTSTNMPRGRNDFKSLSEKWQQISSSSNSTATTAPVPAPANNVSTEAKVATPTPSIQPSHNNYSLKSDQEENTPASRLRMRGGVGESREREREERKPWIVPRRLDTESPTLPTTTTSSTKRSVSVNDIRKAFEKAEMAVNTYGRDDNSSDNVTASKKFLSGKETDSSSILSPPSAHFRVSSFDSTTSEDSSANTPAGIYGSVSNLLSSSSSAQKDPYGSITSLASSTSLISPQELQQLIDEANQSLEEAGTPSHEVSVVILHREFAGGSLGITLAGGADYETKEITVHKVLTGSIADRDGRIHRGDRVLSINGKSTKGCTHRDALNLLKAPRTEVVLVVSRGRSTSNGFQTIEETTATLDRAVEPLLNGSLASLLENDEDTKYNWGPMRTVILNKDGAGLGFSLEGGQGSISGDKPLTIKKIFVGGPAEKSGALKVGDLIISINDVNMSTKSRTEAWNFMKKLSDGEVKLMVKSPM